MSFGQKAEVNKVKVLIVGMNPSNKNTKGLTSSNATFRRLESWMSYLGIHFFSFINTFDDVGQARLKEVDFQRLDTISKDYQKIIALGGFVSSALDKIGVDHFKLPHPSPRNRALNDKDYEQHMLEKCEEYLR